MLGHGPKEYRRNFNYFLQSKQMKNSLPDRLAFLQGLRNAALLRPRVWLALNGARLRSPVLQPSLVSRYTNEKLSPK